MDAVQETWLRVIKYGKSFRAGSTFRTWLYRILINTAKDTGAKSSRMQVFAKGGTGSSLPVSELPEHPDSQEQPDRARIRAAIETLSGDHRLLILLCYHQNLTHPQAAEVLDIPVGTLKSRLNTALTKLRAQLNEPEA
jgi:RNA polymerase sigma-70 factor (ECF subfamily)